jgi:hypothetical protein
MSIANSIKKIDKIDDKSDKMIEIKNLMIEYNNNEKHKIALKLINKILVNIGKTEIEDLCEFKDIDRDDIIRKENTDILVAMEEEIFKFYSKYKCGYTRKTDNLVLNCLRGMMKEINYNLLKVQKDIRTTIDGKPYRRTHMIYSINKN